MINSTSYTLFSFKGKLWLDTREKNEDVRYDGCDFVTDMTRDPRIEVYTNGLLYKGNNRPKECKRSDLPDGVIEVDFPDDGTDVFVNRMAEFNNIILQDKKPE